MSTVTRNFRAMPDAVWIPLSCSLLMVVPGVLSIVVRQPWLFPSLAPTALLLTATPHDPSAKFYNSLVGHLLAIGTGMLMVVIFNLWGLPGALSSDKIEPPRMWATVTGMAVLPFIQILLRAKNAPAAATLLLITLGAYRPHWGEIRYLFWGILITVSVGEIFRRVRLESEHQDPLCARPGNRDTIPFGCL